MKKQQNWTQFAKSIGLSKQLLNYHRRQPDAPKTRDRAAWEAYLADVCRDGALSADIREAIGKQRLRLVSAQAAKAERENQVALGELESGAHIAQAQKQLMQMLHSVIQRHVRDCPSLIVGKDEIGIRQELQKFADSFQQQLADEFNRLHPNDQRTLPK